jgi:hypothetical protein
VYALGGFIEQNRHSDGKASGGAVQSAINEAFTLG